MLPDQRESDSPVTTTRDSWTEEDTYGEHEETGPLCGVARRGTGGLQLLKEDPCPSIPGTLRDVWESQDPRGTD